MARYYDHSQLRAMAEERERENPPPAILDCGHAPGHHDYFVVSFWTGDDGKTFCHACREARANARILDCGHTPTVPHSPMTSGTAHTPDGREICCDCADRDQRERLKTATASVGYLNLKRRMITTWTGGHLATVTAWWTIYHNKAGTLTCWRARDAEGREWYGRGSGDGMATRMHARKGQ